MPQKDNFFILLSKNGTEATCEISVTQLCLLVYPPCPRSPAGAWIRNPWASILLAAGLCISRVTKWVTLRAAVPSLPLSLGEATAHAEEDPVWIQPGHQPWMRQLPHGLAGKTQIKEPLFQCVPPAGPAAALGRLIQALLVLLPHGRRAGVIPSEQDPPSIPDVLGWRLCRGARPWDFSWGQTP